MSAATVVLSVLLALLFVTLIIMAFYYRKRLSNLGLQAAEGAQRVLKPKPPTQVGIDNPTYGLPSPNNTRIPISAPIPQDGTPYNAATNVSTIGPPSPNLQLNAHNAIPKQLNKNINEYGAAGNVDPNKVDNKQIEKNLLSNIVDTGKAMSVKVVLPHDTTESSDAYFYDKSKLGEPEDDTVDLSDEDAPPSYPKPPIAPKPTRPPVARF